MTVPILKKPFCVTAVVIAVLILLGMARVHQYIQSPDVLFLVDRQGAVWIKKDTEFDLEAKKTGAFNHIFQHRFYVAQPVAKARVTVQALKKFQLVLDDVFVFSSRGTFDDWKQVYDVDIPFPLKSGWHNIKIHVQSPDTHPAVIVYSDSLPVKSRPEWYVSEDGKTWERAASAASIRLPAISKRMPSSWEALTAILPGLAVVFVLVFFASFFDKALKNKFGRLLEPSSVRWMMLILWGGLSLNNLVRLNFQVGADGWGHIEYLEYLLSKRSLPLAPEGWQMFQPPLNYLLSAPLYAYLSRWFDWPVVVKMMAGVPVACGLLQIEIVYRIARVVFSQRKDLQNIAVVTGALLPVHTYACQYFGNEPLLGVLLSYLILLLLPFVSSAQSEQKTRTFIWIGIVWGLALLTKMTALLMTPVIVVALLAHAVKLRSPATSVLKNILAVFGAAVAVSGWYYYRNDVALGNPFAGPLDHQRFIQWWQDPGYRTWSQILSFGRSFVYPLYSGVVSFWDAVYSNFWLDGFNSGIVDFVPWNVHLLLAGQLLGLIPSFFIVTAVVVALVKRNYAWRNAVVFSLGTILLFLAAMMDRFIQCSFYSSARSFYLLSVIPCFAIVVAAGMEPFLHRRCIKSSAVALWACWAFAAWAAYFVLSPQ
jgi:hypothetical protein